MGTPPLRAETLRGAHLLLLPHGVGAAEVSALLRQRVPGTDLARDGRAVLADRAVPAPGAEAAPAVLLGPLPLTWRARRVLGLPTPFHGDVGSVVGLVAPVQRSAEPPAEADRDGLHRAFPQGRPVGAELEGLVLLLALARRLGGAVRTCGTSALLRPDPARAVDLRVRTSTWVEPDELLAALEATLPEAESARSGDLEELLDAADQALTGAPPVPEPYVVSGRRGRTDLVLLAHPEDDPSMDVAAGDVTYEVQWDVEPGAAGPGLRSAARAGVAAVTAALVATTGGTVLDEDSFVLDLRDLQAIAASAAP
ncbi:hypothetical protein GTR02_09575 [Kineococcus sp. R8]|uniref:hypothetical protein n=1 Tax=Kineococcus siccus TaxID=2696567 RepID=UPI0014136BA9|nr:hypothetical protein [Kineococcus siccus]NAZ82065.1 hypothetical protein [Kineococcus siccus]